MRLAVLIVSFVFAAFSGVEAADSLPRPGQMSHGIAGSDNPNEKFTVFLPSAYNKKTQWPVLVLFSPGGGGKKPAMLYGKAASHFGWIIIASETSRNGRDPSPTFKAVEQLMKSRLSVNPSRIYAGGMSGGARVALMFAASRPDGVAGLIQSAAAQVNEIDQTKSPNANTAFVQTIGSTDYNYPEIIRYAKELRMAERKVRTLDYIGGHGWPPEEIAAAAIYYCEMLAQSELESPNKRLLKELVKAEGNFLMSRLKDPVFAEPARRWVLESDALLNGGLRKLGAKASENEQEAKAWDEWRAVPLLESDNPSEYTKVGDACVALRDAHPKTAAGTRAKWMMHTFIERLTQYANHSKSHRKDFLKLVDRFKKESK